MNAPSEIRFDHLTTMTDERGLFEHADHTTPRIEHGYCTDDNARLLAVTAREPDEGQPAALGRIALRFVLAAQVEGGAVHNRMSPSGSWTDAATTADCWGRSLLGLGTAAAHHDDPRIRAVAMEAFDRGAAARSPWSRSMAFAALGAIEVLSVEPTHRAARLLLGDAAAAIGEPTGVRWAWPQPRLTYANATLAEVVMAAGGLLDDRRLLDRGVEMLTWLFDRELRNGHLSPTGTDGSAGHEVTAQFDQQPIEVAAMADACHRAHHLTGDARWRRAVELAGAWFDGHNDVGIVMWDPQTGGCFDGLEPNDVNRNQGAESTLALISTRQRVRSLDLSMR